MTIDAWNSDLSFLCLVATIRSVYEIAIENYLSIELDVLFIYLSIIELSSVQSEKNTTSPAVSSLYSHSSQ